METILERIRKNASAQSGQTAYSVYTLDNYENMEEGQGKYASLTWGELEKRSGRLAAYLQRT